MKNIAWAVGAVIYSGKETKIMMNSKKQKERCFANYIHVLLSRL